MAGTVASWLVRPTPEQALRDRALAGDIVLCSWQDTLTVPLSTQVYKWVSENLMLVVTLRWTSIPSRGGVKILPVASCDRNRDKLWSDGPLGPNADFTFLPPFLSFLLYVNRPYEFIYLSVLDWQQLPCSHDIPLHEPVHCKLQCTFQAPIQYHE